MFSGVLVEIDGRLDQVLADLDPACVHGPDAKALLARAVSIKRRAAAVELLLAHRTAESGAWRGEGDRSAAHWLARTTGISVGRAVAMLETADRLEDLPTTADQFKQGKLSEPQTEEIASGAGADPASENELLELARLRSLLELRERSRAVRRAVQPDDGRARHDAIRRGRYARRWTDHDGAGRIDLRGTPEDIARMWEGVQPAREQVFRQAREAGVRDSYEAYTFDAFLQVCSDADTSGAGPGPGTMVHVVVDAEALGRGRTEAGETCEIPGVGPVPVATVRKLLGDAVVEVLIGDAVDVKAVVKLGRTITAAVRAALERRDPRCAVPGCGASSHLQIHHLFGYAITRRTRIDELARICKWHHDLITYSGYQLAGRPGEWQWIPPPVAA